jgi:type VI secretion system protein ImpF
MEPRDQQGRGLARDPHPARRLHAPLFDRLTNSPDAVREPSHPFRSMEMDEAIESVRRDLVRLLNTRSTPLRPSAMSGLLTTLDYGLPDFAHASAADPTARAQIADQVARVIQAFEPRLSQVRIVLEPHPSGQRFLVGRIEAKLTLGLIPETVSFPLELTTGDNASEIEVGEPAA